MSTENLPQNSPATNRRRLGMIIAMIPLGAVLGFIGGLLIEIIVGLVARSVFSSEHPGTQAWQLLGSLPVLGALIGAVVAPILLGRSSKGPTK
jgi:MFS superfamily sulfate permease-like transporter